MPKNKVQEVIFTVLMVFVMVYAMICYNIAVETGGMTNLVFLHAFRELLIMGPIAFLLDFFLVGGLAKKAAFRIVNPEKDNPFHLVLAISAVSVLLMCPLMSLAATLLFKATPACRLSLSGLRQRQRISPWHCSGSCSLPVRWCGSCSGI